MLSLGPPSSMQHICSHICSQGGRGGWAGDLHWLSCVFLATPALDAMKYGSGQLLEDAWPGGPDLRLLVRAALDGSLGFDPQNWHQTGLTHYRTSASLGA